MKATGKLLTLMEDLIATKVVKSNKGEIFMRITAIFGH